MVRISFLCSFFVLWLKIGFSSAFFKLKKFPSSYFMKNTESNTARGKIITSRKKWTKRKKYSTTKNVPYWHQLTVKYIFILFVSSFSFSSVTTFLFNHSHYKTEIIFPFILISVYNNGWRTTYGYIYSTMHVLIWPDSLAPSHLHHTRYQWIKQKSIFNVIFFFGYLSILQTGNK